MKPIKGKISPFNYGLTDCNNHFLLKTIAIKPTMLVLEPIMDGVAYFSSLNILFVAIKL